MIENTGHLPAAAGTTAARGQPALDGLRVLFLPKNSRAPYFASFLAAACAQCGWHVHIVCPESANEFWVRGVGTQTTFTGVPDFASERAWEADAATLKELDAHIAQCELAAGISAGRVVLAGERDLGRGFSLPFYHWFHNRIARSVLNDNSQPFVVLRRMFAFARDTLAVARPDIILAGEWADPLCFVFYLVAKQMGIPCAVNRLSKIWSGRCYWSSDALMYNREAKRLTAEKRTQDAAVSKHARERLAAFRAQPATLGYVQRNWDENAQRGWFGGHLDLARQFAVQLRHALGYHSGPPPKPALQMAREHYRRPFLKWRQAGFFRGFDEGTLLNMPYLFIALHKDPEQALNYQAPFWSNQYNTVAFLSGSLPAGYKLLVREHRLNTGRRPTRYYRELSRLPDVILVDAFDTQFKYINNADLVVTDNGSTGWEALMLGCRVLTLADNFYEPSGLAHRIRQPEKLADTILRLLDTPAVRDAAAHDDALGWLMDAEWETTAPLEDNRHEAALDLVGRILTGGAGRREENAAAAG